ncbi:MAG TPA: radical SAM protein [Acidimicrobiales bacterium]|nr:radical SAM protein [Acidimicrobiales bacterium]
MAEGLRWRLAGDDAGQGSLFDADELLDRHFGTGEFKGIEFLHVNARRIINEVPASSRMPFRYTINAYRGCSHACSYCVWEETAVLMGDGTRRRIADLRTGDVVFGTICVGNLRRLVRTPVVDHWRTLRDAWRVLLADGTELIASGDHRFLTPRGWAHVAVGHPAAGPVLSSNNSLMGPELFGGSQDDLDGAQVGTAPALAIKAVEPLAVKVSMYDITTGTGDFIANGVVSHNCFARPTHEYLGLNIGSDFESKIVVKINAVERVRAELAAARWSGEPIAMGTNTDPYQPCEGKYHLTRGIVEALSDARNPFSILTKSTLVLRDLDLLAEASRRTTVRVSLSIGTLDEDVWRATEPGTPHPRQRVNAVRRLSEAGVETGVLVAPVIPGMSDGRAQVGEVVRACREAGAGSVSTIGLHLRPGVREHFMGWLAQTRPDLVPRYQSLYGGGSYLPKAAQERLAAVAAESGELRRGFTTGHERDPGEPAPPPAGE